MQLVFWVTTDCNLRCNYCYEGQNKMKKYMSVKTAVQAIQYFMDIYKQTNDSELQIRFHGGEPLLNTKAITAVQEYVNMAINRDNVIYSITTNGCVYSKQSMYILKNCMDEINISIDGPEEINDQYRKDSLGRGTYTRIIKTAKCLKKFVDIKSLNIRITYNSNTVGRLAESIIHFIELGFTEVLPTEDVFDSGWSEEKFVILQEQLKIVQKYIESTDARVHVGGLDLSYFKKRGQCDGGINNFHIYPDGNIYPCTYVVNEDMFCLGNVFQGIKQDKVNKLKAIYSNKNKDCIGCTYYEYCPSTRCKLVNWKLTGSYFEPNGIICAAEQVRLRLGKLI